MRFILSALVAATLLGTMAIADVRHKQQAAFRLEPRHEKHHSNGHHRNHHEMDHSHPHKSSSSQRRRRDLSQTAYIAPSAQGDASAGSVFSAQADHMAAGAMDEKRVSNYGLHHKQPSHRHHKKDSHNRGKKGASSHKKKSDHALKLHHKNKKANHSYDKKSSSCRHHKRELSSEKANMMMNKKNIDMELAFHRKIKALGRGKMSKSKSKGKGKSNKSKRDLSDKKMSKENIDTELAFHRKISRHRKTKDLGKGKSKSKKGKSKKSKRDVIPEETLTFNNMEYTVIRPDSF